MCCPTTKEMSKLPICSGKLCQPDSLFPLFMLSLRLFNANRQVTAAFPSAVAC